MRKLVLSIPLCAPLFLGGCTAMLHDAIVDSYPGYAETMQAAPSLSPSNGRIILFYPRLPMAGFNPIPLAGGGGAAVDLTIDKTRPAHVGDQTFVFIDLPAGLHTISQPNGWFGRLSNSYNTPVDLKAGETIFVKIVAEQFTKGPPEAVPPDEAVPMLQDLHHDFKLPLPIDRQPSDAMEAI